MDDVPWFLHVSGLPSVHWLTSVTKGVVGCSFKLEFGRMHVPVFSNRMPTYIGPMTHGPAHTLGRSKIYG